MWNFQELFKDKNLKLKEKVPVFPDMLNNSNMYPDLRHTTPQHIRNAISGYSKKECTENGCSTV
jgi:hypothetical protein